MSSELREFAYLIAAVLFILGLKALSHPRTAVRGNVMGAVGMLIAIVVTLLDQHILGYGAIAAGIVIGSALGAWLAVKVPMTAMPQMVALLNGFGGLASVLVAGGTLPTLTPEVMDWSMGLSIALSGIIGGVTFTGSVVAYAKLEEIMPGQAILLRNRHWINAGLGLVCLLFSVWLMRENNSGTAYTLLALISFVLGVLLVIPIGGADMPVVISLLNSYSGLAAAATGFVINNSMLIIAGSLVGSSGVILCQIMCKAMNRSLINVMFGGSSEAGGVVKSKDEVYGGKIKETSADEIAMLLESARRVVIVPGYGLAVSQAQHTVRDLTKLLEKRGCTVEFGIHPVAGRMPGHMNVLLAEAEIPYDLMLEMDQINPTFPQTDISIIIGANDVVNPMARTDATGPIAGMPILDVDKSRIVIVIKRSLSPGFAGIPNPLFAADNTLMLFADAKKGLLAINSALAQGS